MLLSPGGHDRSLVPFIESDPVFYDLLDDARVMDVVEGLLGEDCLYTGGSDGNYYVGDTRWHADGGVHADNGVMGPFRLAKAAFYLDPVSEGSGCLSVLPGSHDPNYGASISPAQREGLLDPGSPDVPGRYPVESMPGDMIVFDSRLWHSSFGGRTGRRMFTMNFAQNPVEGWQATYLYGLVQRDTVRVGRRLYSDRLVSTAGPRRHRKLTRLLEMGL